MATITESFNTYWKSFQERFNSLSLEKKKEVGTIVLATGEEGLHIGISGGPDAIEYMLARLLDCDAVREAVTRAAMKVALGVFDKEKKQNQVNPTDLFNEIIGKDKEEQ